MPLHCRDICGYHICSWYGLNLFAPTRTLLHTYNYNRHDHHHHHDHDDHHHHHHHHHNHHLYLHEGIKIRHPYEQYVAWGNNTNYICMRDQNSPPLWAIC